MKTMGFSELVLVRPKQFPSAVATERASSADDILQRALVVDDLEDAIADCHWIIGTSARSRTLEPVQHSPKTLASVLSHDYAKGRVALVFGRENNGLTNHELELCHAHLTIPTNPEYSSLNLAMAVQVVCYELRQWALECTDKEWQPKRPKPVSSEEMQCFYAHLESVLIQIGFLDPEKPRRLMSRLRLLFGRAAPDKVEMNILRGMLTAVEKQLKRDREVS